MKVMVMIKATRGSEAGEMPSEQLLAEMGRYNEELVKAGIMQAGEGLHPSSNGKRVRFSGSNRTVVDGPFAETKELVAGFWMWKVKSMEEAVEWVKRCPNPMTEDSEIEIRQVFSAEDFGEAFTPELREQEASIRAQSLGLGEPRFEQGRELLVAGIERRYTGDRRSEIPQQWEQFAPQIGKVPGQSGKIAYGVVRAMRDDRGIDYLTGVEVTDLKKLPADYRSVQIPAGRYIVFTHAGHVSEIGRTCDTIWSQWAPECGLVLAQSPWFERYTEAFNPQTGRGGIEIWLPLKS